MTLAATRNLSPPTAKQENNAIHAGQSRKPIGEPTAAVATMAELVPACATNGPVCRHSSVSGPPAASKPVTTPAGSYGGPAGTPNAKATDTPAIRTASTASIRVPVHQRSRGWRGSVSESEDTSHPLAAQAH